ncbi:hypothetical protein PPBDW_II0800 [Photobacterium kishitanii]|nr:hypothetical protein PPBDW_II0800 [Photobacterium kishitanii]
MSAPLYEERHQKKRGEILLTVIIMLQTYQNIISQTSSFNQ